MLRELRIHNFLSYSDTHIKFHGEDTTAIIGKVGHGKSSFAEAIKFALYGEGRLGLTDMVRIGAEDTMDVTLALDVTSGILRIVRGINKRGSGYCNVFLNKDLKASGSAKPGNNEAQDYINKTVGIDSIVFDLTSFFGMGKDTLLEVRPAECLETLQAIANISICQRFNSKSSALSKEQQIKKGEEERALEVLQGVSESAPEKFDLERKQTSLNQTTTVLKEKQTRYSELGSKLKNGATFILLEKQCRNHLEEIEKKQKHIRRQFDEIRVESTAQIKKKLDAIKEENIKSIIEEKKIEVTKKETLISLRELGIKSGGSSKCPLCLSPIKQSSVDKWKSDIEQLRTKILQDKLEIKNKRDELERYNDLKEKLESSIEYFKLEDSKKEYTAKLKATELKVASYKKLETEYEKLSSEIDELRESKATLGAEITEYRKSKKRRTVGKSKLITLKQNIKEASKLAEAYDIVAQAFSRYNIPVSLLSGIRKSIERKATKIYSNFDSGEIKIRDIEGAKPGVEFVLEDVMGARPYAGLSRGEKTLVFLAVRVAITQIINASRNNQINFLILDEVTSNLDPDKRDSLTRLINKTLKGIFPQVFVMSHIPIKNIFTRTLSVIKNGNISEIVES